MVLNKLSREELLEKCEELGLSKYKSKNKQSLISLIEKKGEEKKKEKEKEKEKEGEEKEQEKKVVNKIDIYNDPEYLEAVKECSLFEESKDALHYKNIFCLKECYSVRSKSIDTIMKSYEKISPYIVNTLEEIFSYDKNKLCVLGKKHDGECNFNPNLFISNDIADKLKASLTTCIYSTPGNDDYIFKNRSSRLFPIFLSKTIERTIRDKKIKLSCAIPLREYTTPFMLATAYIDWICYIVNIHDITELINNKLEPQYKKFTEILKNKHKLFLNTKFKKYNRKLFDDTNKNTICTITHKLISVKNVSDVNRDNRIVIDPDDIQMGHVNPKNDKYFSIRGLNLVMMSRRGNELLGSNNFVEDKWIIDLQKITNNFLPSL